MDNLGDIYNLVLIQLNKDQWGGYVTPDNFNEVAPKVNIEKMNDLVRVFEEKREITRDLFPFIKTLGDPNTEPLTFDTYGYADKPEDYFYFARGEYNELFNNCGGVTSKLRMVEYLDQAKFNYRISNSLNAPTTRQPIITDQNDKLLIRPVVNTIRFTYVKTPNEPFYDYDIIDGIPVYLPPNEVHVNSSVLPSGTPSRSVEFEYPIAVYPDLVERLVRNYAIQIKDQLGIQTTNVDN